MGKTQMKNNHPLIESITAEPLLVDRTRADLVSSMLSHLTLSAEGVKLIETASATAISQDDFWGNGDDFPYRPYVVHNGTLQIPVQGVLLNKFSYSFGRWATGYQYIEKALHRGLDDSNVRAIALLVDSPGGMVAGCFELADKIFSGRERKPIRAFAADHAYSAAYALASSASEIVVTRSGGTGSVGVVTAHVDQSGALEKKGIKVTFVFAGDHKVDGNPYQALPKAVKNRMQQRIDRIYGVFTWTVARNRGMEQSEVIETKALTYDAEDSINVGFADRTGSLEEEMVVFADEATETEDEQMSFTQEQMDAAVASAKAEGKTEGLKEGKAQGVTEGSTAAAARITAIMGSDAGKVRPKAAMSLALKSKDSAEDVISMLGDLPEEKAETAPAGSLLDGSMSNSGGGAGVGDGGTNAGGNPDAAFMDSFFGSIGVKSAPARN